MVSRVVPAIWIIAGEIEQIDTGKDDEETAQQRDGVNSRRRVEALEKEERSNEGTRGERYVVKGIDTMVVSCVSGFPLLMYIHVRVELAEGFVEVVHLSQNAAYNHNDKNVGRRMAELVVACKCHFQGCSKCLDCHDGHGAGGRADGEINERVFAAVFWGDLQGRWVWGAATVRY